MANQHKTVLSSLKCAVPIIAFVRLSPCPTEKFPLIPGYYGWVGALVESRLGMVGFGMEE